MLRNLSYFTKKAQLSRIIRQIPIFHFHRRLPFIFTSLKVSIPSPVTNHFRFLSLSPCSKKDMDFKADKEKFFSMDLNEKRKFYNCGSKFITLDKIPTWKDTAGSSDMSTTFKCNNLLNEKVSLFEGDITALEIDAIVNAANNSLRGGGGVDGAIHRSAGKSLLAECITLKGCSTGDAKITGGYKLPAKYVIHTVGPVGEQPVFLEDCYKNSLNVAKENGARTVAFPCISTGIYGYPNENAANVAIGSVREFLEEHSDSIDRVIFCLFLPVDIEIYNKLMHKFFPVK